MSNQVVQSIQDIQKRRQDRKQQTKQIYKTIITDVLRHVQAKDKLSRNNTIYRIPSIVYGNPSYNIAKATYYIMHVLTKGGFVVFPYENNHIYIDWSVIHQQQQQQQQQPAQTRKKRVTFDANASKQYYLNER